MLSALINNCTDMVICQRVKDRFSLSSVLYQLILFQNTELMRNCRLCHVQCFCKITYTYFCFKQYKQNTDSGGISKNFE